MIQHLDAQDLESFKFLLDFLQVSLAKVTESTNSEKWVRNQAMQ